MLVNKYSKEIDRILGKFPPERKRAAALPLLYLAQREYGHVSKEAIREVADILDVDPTQVGGLVGFYSLLHAKAGGKYRLQVCTDLPCALRGAEEFAEELCENLRIKIGETTEDGLITVEEVKCLAGCDKAPMFQLQAPDGIHYFENQDLESAMALIEELRQRGDDA
ncbi:MAG: NAD(P)H-dependent oxidoreductase subunit E [Anaerolineales bacterium]|nr:NAD(P)H-dependent oxidoreductase subunit E [Anaerolineales bacterium]